MADKRVKEKPMPLRWDNIIASIVLEGMNHTDAMRAAHYSDAYVRANGCLIKTDDRFCVALADKRKVLEGPGIMDKRARQQLCSDLANDKDRPTSDRLRALELLGKSCGDYLDVKVDLTPQSLADIAAITSGEAILELEGADDE